MQVTCPEPTASAASAASRVEYPPHLYYPPGPEAPDHAIVRGRVVVGERRVARIPSARLDDPAKVARKPRQLLQQARVRPVVPHDPRVVAVPDPVVKLADGGDRAVKMGALHVDADLFRLREQPCLIVPVAHAEVRDRVEQP